MEKLIDLHVHTTASDGTMAPTEIVEYAHKKGIAAIAITDHDTISGIDKAQEAGKKFGIEIIPGVEISVDSEVEMHILGYFIEKSDYLNRRLDELRKARIDRNQKIISKLNELGVQITVEEVRIESGGEAEGRPHIAALMVRKGYCKDMKSVFDEYLGRGKQAFFEREKITVQEGINLILQAGGIPILAHPRYLSPDKLEGIVTSLAKLGLAGIEALYSINTEEETKKLISLAKKHNLVITGGTDFHGANKPEIDIGTGLGDMKIAYEILEGLKNLRKIIQ